MPPNGGFKTWCPTQLFTLACTSFSSSRTNSTSGFSNPLTVLKDSNTFTQVGAGAGVLTAGVGAAVALSAEPELLVEGALLAGAFLYFGYKEERGEYVLPFLHSDEQKAAKKLKADTLRSKCEPQADSVLTEAVPA